MGDVGYLNTELLPARLDAFAVGMAAAALYVRVDSVPSRSRWLPWALTAAGLVLLAPQFTFSANILGFILTPTLTALGFGCLLLGAVWGSHAISRAWQTAPLRHLGTIAYSVYLWHLPIIMVAVTRLPDHEGLGTLALLCLILITTLVVSTVSYFLLERPFLDGGRWFTVATTRWLAWGRFQGDAGMRVAGAP
jgi:peptidoglycan/LPS O-acetylase OafA/YrhL